MELAMVLKDARYEYYIAKEVAFVIQRLTYELAKIPIDVRRYIYVFDSDSKVNLHD